MSERPPSEDEYLEHVLDDVLEAYEDLVPPELMEEMRAFLGDVLATHPVGATLLDRVRPRAAPFQSGDAAKPGREAEAAAAAALAEAGKKQQGGGG